MSGSPLDSRAHRGAALLNRTTIVVESCAPAVGSAAIVVGLAAIFLSSDTVFGRSDTKFGSWAAMFVDYPATFRVTPEVDQHGAELTLGLFPPEGNAVPTQSLPGAALVSSSSRFSAAFNRSAGVVKLEEAS